MKKENIILCGTFAVIFIIVLALYIPLGIKNYKLNSIQRDIQRVENQIEYNKQQWLNCETNMQLWNEENNENRRIVEQLKEKYNDMVGFTQAWL